MSNVLIEKTTIDYLANAISAKSGESVPMTLTEMIEAVDGIEVGGGSAEPNLQAKTYTVDSAGTETITADAGYDGLSEVEVNVPSVDPFMGVSSEQYYYQGTDYRWKANVFVEVNEGDGDTAGFMADGYHKDYTFVKGAIPANTVITPTTSAQTIGEPNAMLQGAITVAAMPSGTVTAPSTISGTAATVSTGTNTLTLSKTVSVTPSVTTAGYVSSGTAGNSAVSLTANVTTKGAATITPTTTNQTISSGTYLTGTQTISGDANLVAGNIKSGTTIFGVTGNYTGGGGGTLTVATKTLTNTATAQSLSFTSLSGEPKYWFLRVTSQVSSSGSTTYYYITDLFYDGTNIKGNCFRIGSTRRIYNITSGISQSYSGGTLTITGGSSTGATPGQFYGASGIGYELVYVY